MALSRKELRALQAIYGPQKPWFYQKEMNRRRREAALMRDLVTLCQKYSLDLDSVMKVCLSVSTVPPVEF